MCKYKRLWLVIPAASLALVLPSTASADKSNCSRKVERTYSKNYHRVVKMHGTRAPGRNIRKYGVLFRKVVFHATCGEIIRSTRQLKSLLASPPYSHSKAVPPAQPPAGVKSDSTVANGGSSNPMVNPSCESGGNPQVVSPSGQYWGKYQFDYGTWVAHGGDASAYGNAPEWVQDQVAARVQYDAWPNC